MILSPFPLIKERKARPKAKPRIKRLPQHKIEWLIEQIYSLLAPHPEKKGYFMWISSYHEFINKSEIINWINDFFEKSQTVYKIKDIFFIKVANTPNLKNKKRHENKLIYYVEFEDGHFGICDGSNIVVRFNLDISFVDFCKDINHYLLKFGPHWYVDKYLEDYVPKNFLEWYGDDSLLSFSKEKIKNDLSKWLNLNVEDYIPLGYNKANLPWKKIMIWKIKINWEWFEIVWDRIGRKVF